MSEGGSAIDGPGAYREQLARSWEANAGAWTRVIRSHGVESRRVATDAAILDAVRSRSPQRVLDVGCGEGWLVRELAKDGIRVVGVDASAGLIEAARAAGGGEFHQVSYDDLVTEPGRLGLASFDAVVCNFALLHDDIEALLRAFAALLTHSGVLLIQTVHPWSARGDAGYVDGWRTEQFSSFAGQFAEPMPWYFRTLASWSDALRRAGYTIERIAEPTHPGTGEPLSLLIVASPADTTIRESRSMNATDPAAPRA